MERLVAIYNAWDGLELLRPSIENIRPHVDDVIIVWSRMSNRGNEGFFDVNDYPDCILLNFEPNVGQAPAYSERSKRNAGLEKAKKLGFTHFIMMDCDEFYDMSEFKSERDRIYSEGLAGTVCNVQVYFKTPELTVGLDPVTRVPFIHKITPRLKYEMTQSYPFTIDENGGARIDPTRRLNISRGVEWSNITMHHYSWVREDIMSKINNSSANLRNNPYILDDYNNAEEGYFVKMYGKKLIKCKNKFSL